MNSLLRNLDPFGSRCNDLLTHLFLPRELRRVILSCSVSVFLLQMLEAVTAKMEGATYTQ